MRKYSEMTVDELHVEMQRLLAQMRKKEQAGFESEANVLEQKYYFAKSYTMDPVEILSGQQYGVIGEEEKFTVRYLNGVMAWGTFSSNSEEIALPIGRLALG